MRVTLRTRLVTRTRQEARRRSSASPSSWPAGLPPRSRRPRARSRSRASSQVQATINTLTGEFNKANQQYDQVEEQLGAAKARLRQVNKQMARDQAKYEAARKLVVQIADSSYEDSGSTSLAGLLTSSDPSQVLAEASIIMQITGTRNLETQVFLADATQVAAVQQEQQRTEEGIAQLAGPAEEHQGPHRRAARQAEDDPQLADRRGAGRGADRHRQQRRRQHDADLRGPDRDPGGQAVAFVFKQLGCAYVYGSTGPCSVGFDCSGLVMGAWAAAGITIPRDTYSQWAALPHISESAAPAGRPAVLQRHRPRRDVRRRRHDHRRAIARPAGPRAHHEHRLVRGQLRRRRPAVMPRASSAAHPGRRRAPEAQRLALRNAEDR